MSSLVWYAYEIVSELDRRQTYRSKGSLKQNESDIVKSIGSLCKANSRAKQALTLS